MPSGLPQGTPPHRPTPASRSPSCAPSPASPRPAIVLALAIAFSFACGEDLDLPDAGARDAAPSDAATARDAGPRDPAALESAPGSGTFVGTLTVQLTAVTEGSRLAGERLTIRCTTDGTVPRLSSPACAELVLDQSTLVRTIAVDERGATQLERSFVFVRIAEELVGFTSSVPVVVLWSTARVPLEKRPVHEPFTLLTFETIGGATTPWPAEATLATRSGIRIRGSSSAEFRKKPWRVETWSAVDDEDQDVSFLGMPPEADWVLVPPYVFDRALMRNSLAYALSNAFGRYAPRTRHVELFVAGDGEDLGEPHYTGVYEAIEHVKRGAARVDVRRLGPADTSPERISGGYIFKEDRLGDGEVGFMAGGPLRAHYAHRYPGESDITPAQRDYLIAAVDAAGRALASQTFTDPATGRGYETLLDVPSYIDHHIINVFAKNPDAFRLSAFHHKDRGGPLVAGPVWDFDRTMGCSSDPRAGDPTHWDASNITADTTRFFEHGFYRGLFSDRGFREAYWARLGEVLADGGPLAIDRINALIDGYEAPLAPIADRNFARYPETRPRDGSYAAEVEHLRTWIRQRHQWITSCLTWPDPAACTGD